MNILPKKSFHVLNKDNVARVKKDEREANEKAKQLKERSLRAEQEWRLRSLRNGPTDTIDTMELINESKSHLTNKESNEEKEKEKTKNEMKMGVLTFLGGSEWDPVNKRSRVPWYTQKTGSYIEKRDEGGKDEAIKNKDDPMTLMKAILTPPSKPQKYGTGVNLTMQKHKDKYFNRNRKSFEELRRERHDVEISKKREKKK